MHILIVVTSKSIIRVRTFWPFLLAVSFLLHTVYGQQANDKLQKEITTEAKQIETLRKHLEEWGTVTVSQPVQVFDQNAFNLGASTDFDPTKTYISNAAKWGAQGGVAENSGTYIGSGTDVSVTPNGVKATATNTGSDNTQQSLAVVVPTPFPSVSSSVANPVISQREAVLLGINDKLTELIMRQMANPQEYDASPYRVDFAIVQISVNPGWRTQQNYVADCSATCYYQDKQGNIVRDDRNPACPPSYVADGKTYYPADSPSDDNIRCAKTPNVFSVLPLLDAQTLDLQNSESQVTNLILKIAAQYPSSLGQVNFNSLLQAIKSYARSATSSTALTVTNSYSAGSTFGFRIAPSFTAILNPAARRSGSANRLISTSFPVLVALVQFKSDAHRYAWIEARMNSRWLLYQRPGFGHFWSRLGLPMRREEESDRVDWSKACADAEKTLKLIDDGIGEQPNLEVDTLRRDLWSLEAKGIGRATRVSLAWNQDATQPPKIQSLSTNTLSATAPNVIVINGENLFSPAVAVAGNYTTTNILPIPAPHAERSGLACVAIFPAINRSASDPDQVKLTVYCKTGSATAKDPLTLPPMKVSTAPSITKVDPAKLRPGGDITLSGGGYGGAQGQSSIKINGVPSKDPIKNWTDTAITFSLIDATLAPGQIAVSVNVSNQDSNLMPLIVLRNPKIQSIAVSADGQTATLTGSGFGSHQSGDLLVISDKSLEHIKSWTNTTIAFQNDLPGEIKASAKVTVDLYLDGDKPPNPTAEQKDLTVLRTPDIQSIAVSSDGKTATLTGGGFGSRQSGDLLVIDDKSLEHINTWTDTAIAFQNDIPGEIKASGKVTVDLYLDGDKPPKRTAENILTVRRTPNIQSIAVSADGKTATLTGSGFGSRQSGDLLVINEKSLEHINSWIETTIAFQNDFPGEIKAGAKVTVDLYLDGDKPPKPTAQELLSVSVKP